MSTSPLTLVAAFALLASSAGASPSGSLELKRVTSEAVAQNLLGEPSSIEVAVYTPPGYNESALRYPVLYLLHGIGGTFRDWTGGGYQGLRLHIELDALIHDGVIPPLIVVMPTAMNRYLGSFYADSPVTGNWSEFVGQELVAWTDESYRTLATAGGRAVAGHSMGGFGALTLAMDHPGVYSTAYALSPCCLTLAEEFAGAHPGWASALSFDDMSDVSTARSNGALYPLAILGFLSIATPNENAPPFFVDFPFQVDGTAAEPTHSAYEAYFPIERLDEDVDALRGLRGLALDVGDDDQFPHIVPGAAAFSERLHELGVRHYYQLYDGDHRNRVRERLATTVMPFLAEHLDRARP